MYCIQAEALSKVAGIQSPSMNAQVENQFLCSFVDPAEGKKTKSIRWIIKVEEKEVVVGQSSSSPNHAKISTQCEIPISVHSGKYRLLVQENLHGRYEDIQSTLIQVGSPKRINKLFKRSSTNTIDQTLKIVKPGFGEELIPGRPFTVQIDQHNPSQRFKTFNFLIRSTPIRENEPEDGEELEIELSKQTSASNTGSLISNLQCPINLREGKYEFVVQTDEHPGRFSDKLSTTVRVTTPLSGSTHGNGSIISNRSGNLSSANINNVANVNQTSSPNGTVLSSQLVLSPPKSTSPSFPSSPMPTAPPSVSKTNNTGHPFTSGGTRFLNINHFWVGAMLVIMILH